MNTFCNETYSRVSNLTVVYDAYNKVWDSLHEIYRLSENYQKPEGMMILGPSGIGKTRVLTRFAEAFPSRREEIHAVRPVIKITMPAKPTEMALLYQLALAFGKQYVVGRSYQLQDRVIYLLNRCQTRVLIIDEAQHMVRRHSARAAALAGDTLKVIMDEAKTAMVLGGIPEVEEILMADEQIRGRFTYIQSLDPWMVVDNTKDKSGSDTCAKAQSGLASVLVSLVKNSNYLGDYSLLTKPDTVRRIYFATEGRIRFVNRLVAATMAQVIPDNAPRVTTEHLHTAFLKKIYNSASNKDNPFDQAFVERHLDKAGEPFRRNPAWH